jgi:hypothetical protein
MEIFKELSIGGVAETRLIHQLTEANVHFNKYAPILFESAAFTPDSPIEQVKLVKLKFSDMELNEVCSYENIVERGLAMGLKICPMHLGAFLRLNYIDQPEGPYLTVVSSDPMGDENYPTGFYLRNHEGKLWLRGYRAKGETEWPPDQEFIFLK